MALDILWRIKPTKHNFEERDNTDLTQSLNITIPHWCGIPNRDFLKPKAKKSIKLRQNECEAALFCCLNEILNLQSR